MHPEASFDYGPEMEPIPMNEKTCPACNSGPDPCATVCESEAQANKTLEISATADSYRAAWTNNGRMDARDKLHEADERLAALAPLLARQVLSLIAKVRAQRELLMGVRQALLVYAFSEEQVNIEDLPVRTEQVTDALDLARQLKDEAKEERDAARRECEELRARQEWRPIESAPKDGTQILAIWMAPLNGHRPLYGVVSFSDGSWRDDSDCDLNPPTHWQPLPLGAVAGSTKNLWF